MNGDVAQAEPVARCAQHPGQAATGTCDRCGSYFCGQCYREIGGKRFCSACLQRSGVDYLADFKKRVWGKRDGYVWWLGLVGSLASLGFLVSGLLAMAGRQSGGSVYLAVLGAVGLLVFVSYFLLLPWARAGIFAFPVAVIVLNVLSNPAEAGRAIGQQAIPFLIYASAFASSRNKLAFRIDINAAALEKLYKGYYDNQLARAGLVGGGLSMLFPPLALLSLPCAIVGFRRASQREVWPPVGRRKSAIAGMVLSAIGLVEGSIFLFAYVLPGR